MAYKANELFSKTDYAADPQVFPRLVEPKTFGTGTGTLTPCTPVAYNTSTGKYAAWDSNGSNGTDVISGFVWPESVTLDSSNDVLGTVMTSGDIRLEDVVAQLDTGNTLPDESQTTLLAKALTGLKALGLRIIGAEQH